MRRIDALLADYAASHRTRGNLVCHAAGITLIVFGILSLLQPLRIADGWTAAEALLLLSAPVYLALAVRIAMPLLAALAILDVAARLAGDWRIGAAAFVVGWILQAVGHAVYEKAKPAFFRNLAHLLIGPAFLVNEALRIRPIGGGGGTALPR